MLCQYPKALIDREYWQSILVVVVTNASRLNLIKYCCSCFKHYAHKSQLLQENLIQIIVFAFSSKVRFKRRSSHVPNLM